MDIRELDPKYAALPHAVKVLLAKKSEIERSIAGNELKISEAQRENETLRGNLESIVQSIEILSSGTST